MPLLEQETIEGLAEIFIDSLSSEDKKVLSYGMIPAGPYEKFFSITWAGILERVGLNPAEPETRRYQQGIKSAIARAVISRGCSI